MKDMRRILLVLVLGTAVCAVAADWPVLKTYEGECLRRVKMPIGGIGTGTISLAGNGGLVDWQIFNTPAMGNTPSVCDVASGFLIRTEEADGKVSARLLEGPLDTSLYEGGEGCRAPNHAFPRFRDCAFKAAYPLAQVELKDAAMPVAARLEAMNPLVKGDSAASGIPAVLLRWNVRNVTAKPVRVSLMGLLVNPTDGESFEDKDGKTVDIMKVDSAELTGVGAFTDGRDACDNTCGQVAMVVPKSVGAVSRATRISDCGWAVRFDRYWKQFVATGRANDLRDPEAEGRFLPLGTIAVQVELAPNETKAIPFIVVWRYPHRPAWSGRGYRDKPVRGAFDSKRDVGNFYATRYPLAMQAADAFWRGLPDLEAKTIAFVDEVLAEKAPDVVKEAALFNLSTLRTETCFRTADGHFYGWEGIFETGGSCFGSCTHVWGYEHALVDVWPDLAKDMTELQFGPASDAKGRMSFRIGLPLSKKPMETIDAADGHSQCIVKAYENWRKTGDDAWMKRLWPRIRKAVEFCWIEGGWDADCDGVMEGSQHNTMDVNYYGPNPQMEFLYLAALKAAAAMADAAGDGAFAEKCRGLAKRGGEWTEKNLFNGAYYEHRVVPCAKIAEGLGGEPNWKDPAYQLAAGCLVDQLVGDYASRHVGLGGVADERNAMKTLDTILARNASANVGPRYNCGRDYAFPEEPALKMAWYPEGRMPRKPFPYYGENMTGFEYVVAACLAQRGRLAEAEKVVRDIRDRYDGRKRNPFDEAECGHHYARALAAWSVLKAWPREGRALWRGRELERNPMRISSVPFCRVWPGHQRELSQTETASFVRFDFDGAGTFEVRAPEAARRFRRIRPLSMSAAVSREGDAVRVAVEKPAAFVLEFADGEPLHVFADAPLAPAPAPGPGGRLIRFPRGEHSPGVIAPRSGDVVVLDEGAVVHGALQIVNATNVTVTGRGIFDASGFERADRRIRDFHRSVGLPEVDTESACFPYAVVGSKDVTIAGVTFRDSPFWTLVIRNQCEGVLVDGIRILGNWRYNSDGVDVCASRDVVVRNSFFRTFDDCVIARGPYLAGEFAPVSGLMVSNCTMWCDWGVPFKAQVQDFHGSTIENVTVRNCRFANLQQTGFFLAVRYGSDLDVIRGFTAEDIEFDFVPQPRIGFQSRDGERFAGEPLTAVTLADLCSYTLGRNLDNQVNGKPEAPEYYRFIHEDIAFRNLRTYGESRDLYVRMSEQVPRHEIRRVTFEGLPAGVRVVTDGTPEYEVVGEGEYERLMRELEAADIAADRAWDAVTTSAGLKARREELRGKMVAAVGGFPARTPLNPVVTATVPRDGYRVEKVMFESRPHVHVTALAYVPDASRFPAPWPAVLIPCGHSFDGKANAGYQRACAMGAKEGFLMLIYDPFDQGERRMSPDGNPCLGHNRLGAAALRLGLSAAGFRIWDGIRAVDYLQSRDDVRGDRIGLMGNSGGGTMTSFIMALDPRIRAAAPSCYVSSIRAVVDAIGPQDSEQCLYGQLRDGINHASLVLMADAAVRLQFSTDDFFPLHGAQSTAAVVRRTADRLGLGARYSVTTVPGPHGWKESSRRSSLDWMRQWLMDERPNGRTDADYAALDRSFDPARADMGLAADEVNVTPTGRTSDLAGERTFYDILVDGLIGEGTPRLVYRDRVLARHGFYSSNGAAEENAVIAQMLGRDLVADRRDEILAAARAVAAKGGARPVLVAEDSWVRPAELAFAAHPELFAGLRSLGDGTFAAAARGESKDR